MKYFIFILSLFLTMSLWSQGLNYQLKGKITDQDLGSSLGGVKIVILHNGSQIASTTTTSNGRYTLNASGPITGLYTMVYSKAGFVSKRISFDGSNINEEDLPAGDLLPFPKLDLDLFKERENVDFSFLDVEPVAEFFWSEKIMNLDYKKSASAKIRKKIDDLLAKADKDKIQNEINYQKAIQEADAFYASKDYEDAVAKYEEALTYKPTEAYPASQIDKLDALILAQKEAQLKEEQENAAYYGLIEEADKLRDQNKLEAAVSKYKAALLLKNEQYPKDQIVNLNAQIEKNKKEAENQAAYDAAITAGDGFLNQNSLRAAKDKYILAAKLKPSEDYPKTKLEEIEAKLSAQADIEAKKKKYDAAIAEADQLFDAENFTSAKDKYAEALTFEASSTYAKQRKNLCDTKIAELNAEKEQEEKIAQLLASGSAALTANKLSEAKGDFEEVLTLDNQNQTAIDKLALIETKLAEEAELAEKNKEFNALVTAGDNAITAEKFDLAISKYEAALNIKPSPEVSTKLSNAKGGLAAIEAAKKKKEAYDKLITDAGALMSSNDLEGAKSKYEAALKIDATQDLPKNKIKEINDLLSKQAEETKRQADYDKAITEANNLYNLSKWEDAKARYLVALTFTDDKSYAEGRISDIDAKIAEADEKAKRDAAIAKNMADGKSLMSQNKLEAAKSKFEEVIAIDPTNQEAESLINEINVKLASMKNEAEKDAAFEVLVNEGTQLMSNDKLPEAKAKFQEALSLKDDTKVRSDIDKINKLIADQAEKDGVEKEYNGLITEAEGLEASNDLNGAISKYKAASKVKPLESFPKTKIIELQKIIDENASQADIDNRYNALIAEAQNLESSNDLTGAINKYKAATAVKPNESLPKDKVIELQKQLNENANQAEKDEKYNAYMAKGNQLMADENYLAAITEFNNALSIKPNEQEPIDKANEAERLEKDKTSEGDVQYEKILTVAKKKMDEGDYDRAIELVNRAISGRPTDPRPQALKVEINKLKVIDAEYNTIMTQANNLAVNKKYAEAKSKYENASAVKPAESLPIEKAEEMQQLIDQMKSSAQKDELYAEYMMKGNNDQTKENYQKALSQFQNALSVRDGNDVPAQNKINEIQQILDNIANANASDIENKNKFDALVSEADGFFATETYLSAKDKYESALMIDPSSRYVKKQIEECVKLERLKGTVEADEVYKKIIKTADDNFNSATYDKAKSYYQRALGFRPNDPYPKLKLIEIEEILNPSTIASAELQDLGIPFDNSIMDGAALLEKAEKEREALKGQRMKEGIDNIAEAESEMTSEKTKDHQESSNQIYEVYKNIEVDAMDNDVNRQETVEKIKEIEKSKEDDERSNIAYEKEENISDQEVLYTINKEVALEYGERESVYTDNAATMDKYEDALAESIREKNRVDNSLNIEADQDLTSIKLQIDDGVRDDYAERAKVRDQVVDVELAVENDFSNRSSDSYQKVISNSNEVDKIEIAIETRTVEDAKKASENNEDLKIVQQEITNEEIVRAELNQEHQYKTDSEISEVKALVAVEQDGLEENREENAEILKEGNKQLAEAHYNEYNNQLEKHATTKETIDDHLEKNAGVSELAEASHKKKIEYVEMMDKKARVDYEESNISDEEARLLAKKAIEASYTNVEEKSSESTQKREENTETLKDVTKTMAAEESSQNVGEQDKHYDAASKIGDVDASPGAKVIVANELGEEYPEGVSQESFTQNDQNGLMTAIITRRIVVIEGHANVYIRTQTNHGITYSKNGKPSLAHVWNKETQGPHLERHY